MIFNSIEKIKDKSDLCYYLELIDVYCRLVEVFCEKNRLPLSNKENKNLINEFIDMGLIDKPQEVTKLSNVLGKEYERLKTCTSTYLNNKKAFGNILDKLNNKKRNESQQKANKENKPTIVDFFCGAGGLSLGFVQNDYLIKLANDIENVCINTYKYNHPELQSTKVIQGDIKNIVNNIDDYITSEIDVVVGGPPCQGFSSANQQRVIDDPRNKLYKYFIKAIEKIYPKFVVMENVRGMLKVADQVVEDYEKLKIKKGHKIYSYKVAYKLLNSADFSVAQSRERLIYIAIRNDVSEEKHITPNDIFAEIISNNKNNKKYVLKDALKDIKPLEAPRVKNTNEVDSKTTGKKIDVNNYENNSNEYLKIINENRKISFTFNHKARYLSDVNYEIYKKLNPGDDATDEKISDIMPYPDRNNVFKDKYYKLYPDRPSRTITAHLQMDCHSHIHPSQVRALTPREAARVQSFPDDYLFLGPYLKTYMQIGNAVPCVMARGIAKVIKKYL